LDRHLVDYVLTLPPRFIFRDGYTKYILRRALMDLLPKAILNRTTKVGFGELANFGARDMERLKIKELLNNSRLVRLQLVDAERLAHVWDAYCHDAKRIKPPVSLTYFFGSEKWVRRLEMQIECSSQML